ncbi:MAG: coproporphyrinogen III oxidase family protein [Bacteroidales bacterium]|nr:coproporphyrinogen III oxidase family protein [Bacteroidales bacterium]
MIYIHVPFCRSFCTYCDFYSELVPSCKYAGTGDGLRTKSFDEYTEAVCREIEFRKEEILDSAGDDSDIAGTSKANTLYIGGGTPSLLPISMLSRFKEKLKDIGLGSFDEFTLEVNPEDIVEKGPDYASGLFSLGVNRISMGVQSFDDSILKWMNRRHNAEAASWAYGILVSAGFVNISIDLIFGLPQLSDSVWNDTISHALSIGDKHSGDPRPAHISAYQLSIENGSALAKLISRGRFTEADDETCARQYDILCQRMKEAGYRHYEISNFALPGLESLHNSSYWRRVPYAGLGPGAHSFSLADDFREVRSMNPGNLEGYISAASSGDFCSFRESEILGPEEIKEETIMLALRTDTGVDYGYLHSNSSPSAISRLSAKGALEQIRGNDGTLRIRIPENRFFVSDDIIADLL